MERVNAKVGPEHFLLTCHRKAVEYLLWSHHRRKHGRKSEILQGTLDLMVLKALAAMGPQHGYGIARRIEADQRGGSADQSRNVVCVAGG
jgi:hypothetical protein